MLNRATNRKGRGLEGLRPGWEMGMGERTGRLGREEGKRLAGRDGERIRGGDARQSQPSSPVPSPGKGSSGQEGALGGGSLPGNPGGDGGQRYAREQTGPASYLRAFPGR